MMTEVAVYLIGKEEVFKEGVRSLLGKNHFYIIGDYADFSDVPGKGDGRLADLIIHIDQESAGLLEKIRMLKEMYAQSRVAVISACNTPASCLPPFAEDIDALILRDISCDGLVGALRLAAAGKKIYPTAMLTQVSQPDLSAVNSNQPVKNNNHHLSRQELKIVQCLVNGQPNKLIAQSLGITEATVKVHVKTILRKMGAANRTQAAIFAISQGIATTPAMHSFVPFNGHDAMPAMKEVIANHYTDLDALPLSLAGAKSVAAGNGFLAKSAVPVGL